MPGRTTEAAFTGWVERLARGHTRQLSRLAVREGLTGQEAIDATQEAFVTLLGLPQARALSDTHDEALSLLSVIVRNAARNIRKRHHRTRPHVPADEQPLASDETPVDELIAQAEAHAAVLGCVQRLADVQRHVVTLRMIEEMSSAEVAQLLGLTPNHVTVLLHRAKSELRRCLSG
jgi:RNA polymerase sigma-70 factor (ECF subfamily)